MASRKSVRGIDVMTKLQRIVHKQENDGSIRGEGYRFMQRYREYVNLAWKKFQDRASQVDMCEEDEEDALQQRDFEFVRILDLSDLYNVLSKLSTSPNDEMFEYFLLWERRLMKIINDEPEANQ